MGGRFGDYIRSVDNRLVELSRLATCHFGLAVVSSQFWILVVFIRMQTSLALVVSGFGRTPVVLAILNIIAVVTRCSDQRCYLMFGAVIKLFNYLNV